MKLFAGISLMALMTAWPAIAGTIDVSEGQSIQAALNSAKPGDTVAVHAGTYNESIYAKVSGVKLVSVDGKGAAHIVSSGTPLFLQGGSDNTIQGFALTAGNGGNGLQVGGTVSDFAKGYSVTDNIIKNAGLDGIKVHQATGFTFTGNTIENAGTGGGGNHDGGIDFVAVQNSKVQGNTVVKTGGNSCLMLKGGTANNMVNDNSFSGCKDAIHVGGLTGAQWKAPNAGGKEAYNNTITGNNLCGGSSSIYMFDGEKKRQDNTIKGNSCNGAGDGVDITGADPSPSKTALTSRDDVPKVVLPDNSKAKADAQQSLTTLANARKTLTQATATKLPSMPMEALRQQIAEKNKTNCN
jgi:nitrous oxidase accessory protein NosD